MRKILATVSMMIVIALSSPAIGGIIYYENCESAPSSSNWRPVIDGNAAHSFSVSSEQKRSGSKSWKYYIGKTDLNCHNEHRFIGKGLENFPAGKEYWIGMSIFIPSNYSPPSGGAWGLSTQWHASPDSCETWRNPISAYFFNSSGSAYDINVKSQSVKCGTKSYDRNETKKAAFPTGRWHDIVQHVKFGYRDGTAITQFWVDGKQIFNDTRGNCFNDDSGFYLMIGPYTYQWALTMYIDEIRIGDSNSSYAEVAPAGGTAPSSGSTTNNDPVTLSAPVLNVVK